jgi:hypothetical protein
MRRSTKLILVSLISVGLILGGITLVYAANAGGNSTKTKTGNGSINPTATGLLGKGFMFGDRGAILSDIATYLGISEDTLRTDMQNGQTLAQIAAANGETEADLISYIVTQRTNELNTLLTNGKITQTQYDNMPSFKDGFRAGFEKGFKMGENCTTSMNDIANYIGISLDTLQTDLKNGQTLAQIAVANGKTEADLISYIVTQRTKELNTLLTNGKITQDQFNKMTQNLTTQVTNMVEQAWTGKMGPGGMFGKGGKGAGSAFFPGLQNP